MTENSSTNGQFQKGNKAASGHGAPHSNENAVKHNLRSRRKFPVGSTGCRYITTQICILRKSLEALVIEAHGFLSEKNELIIQTACRHENAALLTARWLRMESDSMSVSEKLQYALAIGTSSEKRDKAISNLKLDLDDSRLIIEQLYESKKEGHDV